MLRGYYLATVQAAVELVMSDDLTKRHVVTSHSAESIELNKSDVALINSVINNNNNIGKQEERVKHVNQIVAESGDLVVISHC